MSFERLEAKAWGALLGCKCPDCVEDARRWAVLTLDAALNVISTSSESEDAAWCAPILAASAANLPDWVGQAAFEFLLPQLQGALGGRKWSAVYHWSMHDMPESPFSISITPVFGLHSEITGVQILLRDSTRSESNRMRFIELQEKLAIVQQYAADGIISMDEHGRIQTINLAVETMFGWSAVEMIGRPVTMLMPAREAQQHASYVSRFLQTGQSGILNVGPRIVPALHKDGHIFRMELSVAEASYSNHTVFIGVCRSLHARPASLQETVATES